MTFIRGHGRPRKEHISEAPSESSLSARSDYKGAVSPIVNLSAGSVRPPMAKYTEEDLQRILKVVLKAQVPTSDEPREKLLKVRSPDVYCGKFHMECYNFCQQCENHFTTAGAKSLNRIFFAAFFLRNRINFRWQQHKRKLDAESTVPISWNKFKTFLWQSLGDSRAFVNSYWAKVKRDSQY